MQALPLFSTRHRRLSCEVNYHLVESHHRCSNFITLASRLASTCPIAGLLFIWSYYSYPPFHQAPQSQCWFSTHLLIQTRMEMVPSKANKINICNRQTAQMKPTSLLDWIYPWLCVLGLASLLLGTWSLSIQRSCHHSYDFTSRQTEFLKWNSSVPITCPRFPLPLSPRLQK